MTALMHASAKGYIEIARQLIEFPAYANLDLPATVRAISSLSVLRSLPTPLYHALLLLISIFRNTSPLYEHLSAVQDRRTALDFAIQGEKSDVAALLRTHGAKSKLDLEEAVNSIVQDLLLASEKGKVDEVDICFRKLETAIKAMEANVNKQDEEMETNLNKQYDKVRGKGIVMRMRC